MATPGKHLTEQARARMRQLSEQGVSRQAIAQRLGVSVACVGKNLRKSN